MLSFQTLQPIPWKSSYSMDIQIGAFDNDPPHPPGYINGPIIRDFFTLQLCTSGKGELICAGKTHTIKQGQCFVTFPNTVIEERADKETPWSHLWVLLKGEKVRVCFEELGLSPQSPVFPQPYNHYIKTCLLDLVASGHTSDVFNQIYQLRCICNALMELSHLYGYAPKTLARENLPNHYVHDAIHFIEINYDKKISINDIAASVGINRSYLYTLFKQQTGMSIQDYVISVRIKKACTFLSFPEASISNVAYSVGYDPLVFSKTFKQILGISPREYRKRLLQKERTPTEPKPL